VGTVAHFSRIAPLGSSPFSPPFLNQWSRALSNVSMAEHPLPARTSVDSGLMLQGWPESHRSNRVGWLRAAVLGADDGIVSTASLMIGVAAASASQKAVLLAGLAGEYVSVSSQLDAERADIKRESRELVRNPGFELAELTELYVARGLEPPLARTVAEQLTKVDALATHAREELGLELGGRARPVQAGAVSALSFAVGAAAPLVAAGVASGSARIPAIAIVAVITLALTGLAGGRAGGAPMGRAAIRVTVGGALAMAVTAAIGTLVGAAGL
jgi:VIT1/CCC1 family predicted Fe2+/Mn2+ transporter